MSLTWWSCHHPGCQKGWGRPWACGRRGLWRCAPCGSSSSPAACPGSCPGTAGTPTSSDLSPPQYCCPGPEKTSMYVSGKQQLYSCMMITLPGTSSHCYLKSQANGFLTWAFSIKEASQKWFQSSASLRWFISTFQTEGREILLFDSRKFAWVGRHR